MEIVDKNIKPRYYLDEMMQAMGIDGKRQFKDMI